MIERLPSPPIKQQVRQMLLGGSLYAILLMQVVIADSMGIELSAGTKAIALAGAVCAVSYGLMPILSWTVTCFASVARIALNRGETA